MDGKCGLREKGWGNGRRIVWDNKGKERRREG
jgi:hypothetical protein